MNRVEIKGGLTRDAEFREVGGLGLIEFTLAVNGTRYDREQNAQVVKSIFVLCQAWAHMADQIAEQGGLHRGDEVYVVGELDQYRKDGSDKPSTRVVVQMFSVTRRARSAAPPPPPPESPW